MTTVDVPIFKDRPDMSTPVDAAHLNAWGATVKANADAAEVAAAVAAAAVDAAGGELALKAPLASPAFTGTPTGITKAHVGLGSVDNTSDADKPVSTAQAAAIGAKLDTTVASATYALRNSPAFSGTVGIWDGSYTEYSIGTFTTIPISTVVVDTATAFDTSTSIYTVPTSGIYSVLARVRLPDGTGVGQYVGMGVGVTNGGGPTFEWFIPPTTLRPFFTYVNTMHFIAGDPVHLFAYSSPASVISGASLALNLLRAD